ncbi:VOC family protein [Brevibacillus sp. SYSU BS000544]|uniref:VOC family protein n=1 Tax=Brevibacillus sp. SYSU BS000544 TaxID=3416443 RepID=UPI003CE4B57B
MGTGTPITLYELRADEEMIHSASGSFPILFSDNIEETYEVLKNRGVKVDKLEKDNRTTYFSFTDEDGNKLEVCHWE